MPIEPDALQLRIELSEARCRADIEILRAEFMAAAKALDLERSNLTMRLDHSNGLLQKMETQQREAGLQAEKLASEFARRGEVAIGMDAIRTQINGLEKSRDTSAGRTAGGQPMRDVMRDVAMLIVSAVVGYFIATLTSKGSP